MQKSQMVMGIGGAIMSLPICEECIFGKHQVSSFPFECNAWSTKLLELVHIDLVVQYKHEFIVMPNPLLFSLMTIIGLPLVILFTKNWKSLPNFKPIKHSWKIKSTTKSTCSNLIMVGSLHLKKLMNFVNYIELFKKIQIITPHNKMEF